MQAHQALDMNVDDLPLDVFELVDGGVEVDSLTAGHGMAENAASTCGCPGGTACTSCTTGGCCCGSETPV